MAQAPLKRQPADQFRSPMTTIAPPTVYQKLLPETPVWQQGNLAEMIGIHLPLLWGQLLDAVLLKSPVGWLEAFLMQALVHHLQVFLAPPSNSMILPAPLPTSSSAAVELLSCLAAFRGDRSPVDLVDEEV
jgi:hypothetical protein